MRVKRIGEVVRQGSAAVIVRVPGAGYCASMGDGWRVCIAFGVLPRRLHSFRRALIPAVGSRLGDQVTVSSSATRIFLYAPSIGLAEEAAQVAREVLAQHDINAPVRTEFWSHREQKWRDAANDPSADPAAQQHADPRSLIISANCEDDAKGLGRALSGDGRADTDPAFRVGQVSYRCMYNMIQI